MRDTQLKGKNGDCSPLREWNGNRDVMVNNRDGLFMTPRVTAESLSLPFSLSPVCSLSILDAAAAIIALSA